MHFFCYGCVVGGGGDTLRSELTAKLPVYRPPIKRVILVTGLQGAAGSAGRGFEEIYIRGTVTYLCYHARDIVVYQASTGIRGGRNRILPGALAKMSF